MRRNTLQASFCFLLPALALVVVTGGCNPESAKNFNNNLVRCGDGICERDRGERCASCPGDCCVGCDPEVIAPSVPSEYLISRIHLPADATEIRDLGLDIDGDGQRDNKLSTLLGLLSTWGGAPINESLSAQIASGELLLVARVHAHRFDSDGQVLVSLLHGAVADATPLFNGTDEVALSPGAPTTAYACGALASGVLYAGPAVMDHHLLFPLPLLDQRLRYGRLVLEGRVSDYHFTDVIIGAGLYPDEVRDLLVPALARFVSREIQVDKDSEFAESAASLLDGNCEPTLEGCEEIVNGSGECDASADPPIVTTTEVWCNGLVRSALAPDVDTDQDGEGDLLSIAFQVSAVRATIVE